MQATGFRQTAPDGLQWPFVVRRVVHDACTLEALSDHFIEDVEDGDSLEGPIPGGPSDITTELYYRGGRD